MLDQALEQCAAWRERGQNLTVSVNISASSLLDGGFTGLVAQLLERYKLPAEALVLEVTETTAIVDFERSKLAIEQLRDLAIIVSVDDFGAGFTSLAYLSSLAVGELKLDRSFIKGLSTAEKDRDLALVRSTIELALTGRLDCLDGMLFPSICDVIRNLSGMWQILFKDKYVRYFDVPQNYVDAIGGA